MKIKLIYNSKIAKFLGVDAIVLYPFVLFKNPSTLVPGFVLNHEMIHVEQIKRLGVVWFYLRYAGEFLFGLVRYMSVYAAYKNISLEKEAFAKQERG